MLIGFSSNTRISEIETGNSTLQPLKWNMFLLTVGLHPNYELKEIK